MRFGHKLLFTKQALEYQVDAITCFKREHTQDLQ